MRAFGNEPARSAFRAFFFPVYRELSRPLTPSTSSSSSSLSHTPLPYSTYSLSLSLFLPFECIHPTFSLALPLAATIYLRLSFSRSHSLATVLLLRPIPYYALVRTLIAYTPPRVYNTRWGSTSAAHTTTTTSFVRSFADADDTSRYRSRALTSARWRPRRENLSLSHTHTHRRG